MTDQPSPSFSLTVEAGQGIAHLRLAGVLDYDTSDELTRQATACLAEHPRLRELHLDCARLRLCDSMGISTLLMLHRSTGARNTSLHLDNPPPFLERVLDITGIRHLFSQDSSPRQDAQAPAQTDEASPVSSGPPA
ncbi:STAS domain-containing protein [Streptomyces sp. NPDC059142]|uniref:STAS domain-containing protein n=1 Tax=unclassified Streptomyces TaxID=2593676 RepID=UPI0036AA664F